MEQAQGAGKAKLASFLTVTAVAVFFLTPAACAETDERIHIVGSSTVYPFVTAAAEEFARTTDFQGPLVESTGTGGGFKLFCSGIGADTPDIVNASRAIKESERELCAKNGVGGITEIRIGFDGIVLANVKKAPLYRLTKGQIFSALAKQVPGANGKLSGNPHKMWSDIDPALPAVRIEVYGPPTTSGTRDAFAEMVMEEACAGKDEFKAAWPDDKVRARNCQLIREDGHYIEAGENDNLIVQKLESNTGALGIFGYSFLEQNANAVQGAEIDGVRPAFEAIADGTYGISRPLFVYVKDRKAESTAGLAAFVQELVSDKAAGPDGYLSAKGLVPLPEQELDAMQKRVATLGVQAKSE